MIYLVCSIFDEKAAAYLKPFYEVSKGSALRSLMDVLDDPKHPFSRHSADYTLYLLGRFDDLTGEFNNEKVAVCTLLELRARKEVSDAPHQG